MAFVLDLTLRAQFQGVPPGQFQGVPAKPFQGVPPASPSVPTNARSNAFSGCCANFFLPSGFSPMVPVPSSGERTHRHRRHRDGDNAVGVVADPVYIPYAAAPDDETGENPDSDNADSDGTAAGDGRPAARRGADRYSGPGDGPYPDRIYGGTPGSDRDDLTEETPEEPVVAQPTTLLVFKDGHRSEVVNYAIVGDTLFNFDEERTRKIRLADLDLAATREANDDRGVEFKLPPGSE
jgi:hypothetical protein